MLESSYKKIYNVVCGNFFSFAQISIQPGMSLQRMYWVTWWTQLLPIGKNVSLYCLFSVGGWLSILNLDIGVLFHQEKVKEMMHLYPKSS